MIRSTLACVGAIAGAMAFGEPLAPPALPAPAAPPARAEKAPEAAPDSRSFIAAMPEGSESVMVWRIADLSAEASVLREFALRPQEFLADADAVQGELTSAIAAEIAAAGPGVFAWGGAAFAAPRDIGVGRFRETQIWWTRGPLAGLRERLEKGERITDVRAVGVVEGVTLYAGRVTMIRDVRDRMDAARGEAPTEERFAAVVDDRRVVVASERDDAEAVIRRLLAGERDRKEELPEQWSSAAEELPLESPLVILRRHDPTNERDLYSLENPLREPERRPGVQSFGLAVTDVREGVMAFRAVAAEPERALRILRSRDFFPQYDYRWNVHRAAEGRISAELRMREITAGGELLLRLLAYGFGLNVAI